MSAWWSLQCVNDSSCSFLNKSSYILVIPLNRCLITIIYIYLPLRLSSVFFLFHDQSWSLVCRLMRYFAWWESWSGIIWFRILKRERELRVMKTDWSESSFIQWEQLESGRPSSTREWSRSIVFPPFFPPLCTDWLLLKTQQFSPSTSKTQPKHCMARFLYNPFLLSKKVVN